MSIFFTNEDRRDGDDWPDEDVRAAAQTLSQTLDEASPLDFFPAWQL